MKVAIDINDVIRDYTRQFQKMYNKVIDENFDIEYDNIDDVDLFNVFPFLDCYENPYREKYNEFLYEDCVYEIFCRADVMDRNLSSSLNLWLQNDMRNFDEGKNPEFMFVCPFEIGLSIQSTLSFLSRVGIRAREYYFPIDSNTIWDKCDILITANPNLIKNVPEGKTVIKINAPYNKEINTDYSYDSLISLMNDKENIIIKKIKEQ